MAKRNHIESTVKPLENGHSKIDKTKIFHMTNGSLMNVESIAERSP